MHFRLRKHVVQLIRTSYDPDKKKPKTAVVGSMPLNQPKLSPELKSKLTEAEIAETEEWIDGQHRMNSLKEELGRVIRCKNRESQRIVLSFPHSRPCAAPTTTNPARR